MPSKREVPLGRWLTNGSRSVVPVHLPRPPLLRRGTNPVHLKRVWQTRAGEVVEKKLALAWEASMGGGYPKAVGKTPGES